MTFTKRISRFLLQQNGGGGSPSGRGQLFQHRGKFIWTGLALLTLGFLYLRYRRSSRDGSRGGSRGGGSTSSRSLNDELSDTTTSTNDNSNTTLESTNVGNHSSSESASMGVEKGVGGKKRVKPILTIFANEILLWNPSQDPETPNYAFLERAPSLLQYLSTRYTLIVIVHLPRESYRAEFVNLFASVNSFVDPGRVLFCSTWEGRLHMIRQLGVRIAIEADPRVVEGVRKWVSEKVIWVKKPSFTPDAVEMVQNAEQVEMCTEIWQSSLLAGHQ